jgi:hypothetical protein
MASSTPRTRSVGEPAQLSEGASHEAATPVEFELVPRWPRRRRFLFIIAAASLCWAIPAAVLYWFRLSF